MVGRIQLRYDDGFWNEWYVLFDEGSGGWLSDASGQYVFTLAQGAPSSVPQFEQLKPGGIAQAFGMARERMDGASFVTFLGDNFLTHGIVPFVQAFDA